MIRIWRDYSTPAYWPEQQRIWIEQIFGSIQKREWFGTLTIKIEAGVIKRLVKAESLIPPEE